MRNIRQVLFQILLTVMLFSVWAGFALLVVNKLLYKDLPGYEIGRICIWEFVALMVAAFIAKLMIKNWGNIRYQEIDNKECLIMNPRYGTFFLLYFLIAISVGIWQFWIFSQNY